MATQTLRAGIIAGLVGGAVDGIFLVAALVFQGQPLATALVGFFQSAAAGAIGKGMAYSSPAFAWLGVAMYFLLGIAWALAFAYLAQQRRQLIARPLVSGIVFGFVVWTITQVVLLGAGLFQTTTSTSLAISLIAYCAFFGIPVAYANARLSR